MHEHRTGIYEILRVTESVKKTVLCSSDADTIKRVGIEEGMRSLRQDGADKVIKGISTTTEVLRVTQV